VDCYAGGQIRPFLLLYALPFAGTAGSFKGFLWRASCCSHAPKTSEQNNAAKSQVFHLPSSWANSMKWFQLQLFTESLTSKVQSTLPESLVRQAGKTCILEPTTPSTRKR